jgi:predicted acylesterase/phospholipase RssA
MEEDLNVKIFDSLVLEGGGMYGFYHIGALSYLYENGHLNSVKNFSGTSIGSVICYLLIIGCSPIEILLYLHTNQISQKLKNSMNLKNVIENKGIINLDIIRKAISDVTCQKIGKEITMSEVKKRFNKNLIICTFNYTKKQTEYITSDTHPDMPCLDALICSCSIPLLFDWFDYDGYIYIDGGFTDNFPVEHQLIVGNVLGIVVKNKNEDKVSDAINKPNIIEFIYEMFNYPKFKKMQTQIENNKKLKLIEIENTEFNCFSFGLNAHTTLEMFSTGYNFSKKLINN